MSRKFLEETQGGIPISGKLFNLELIVKCIVIKYGFSLYQIQKMLCSYAIKCHQNWKSTQFNMVEVTYRII